MPLSPSLALLLSFPSFTQRERSTMNRSVEPVDIIFLDIDGVLLPFGGSSQEEDTYADGCIFPNQTMSALTSLLQQLTELELQVNEVQFKGNPKLVLSSTWRAQPSFIQDILSSFQSYSNANPSSAKIWQMHSSFFDITDPLVHSTRHEEIYNWVNIHTDKEAAVVQRARLNVNQTSHSSITNCIIRSWIALDDEELVQVSNAYRNTHKHAVKTESSVGLSQNDVKLALKLIVDQIKVFDASS
eukprot:scaffold31122_cov68-Cyclotella_meneghiniana.AAC.2